MTLANESRRTGARAVLAALLLTVVGCLQSCSTTTVDPTGGETHFLTTCDARGAACGAGLACLCGVCTLSCDGASSCGQYPSAQCMPPSGASTCTQAPLESSCDVPCASDGECTTLSSAHRCEQGRCRAAPSDAGSGAGGDAASCQRGDVVGNDVLVIGDSFFAATHSITAYLESLARSAGALADGDRYRDNSSLNQNTLALNGKGLAQQYAAAADDEPVKVVVMNGGGADALLGSCDTPSADCPLLTDATSAARALFVQLASDGVEHVVYVFYPDPAESSVRAKIDALRPMIEQACSDSPVACHWVDLRPTFADHYAEYISSDGLDPTAAGSAATAEAIWSVMQQSCVAQ